MIKDDNKMARQCNDDGAMAQLSDCAMTRWYESDGAIAIRLWRDSDEVMARQR